MASVYPATQWTTVERIQPLPMFAASDIVAGTVVRVASSGDWTVQMCASSNEMPLGIARDDAQAGKAVSVWDMDVKRSPIGAGGSVTRQAFVGVVGTSTAVHRQSGVTVTYPVLGAVAGVPSVAVGASSAPIWAVGQALESSAIGDNFAFFINPRELSGLVVP